MDKKAQKDLLKFQLDHQPRQNKWKLLALEIAVISGVTGVVLVALYAIMYLESVINGWG